MCFSSPFSPLRFLMERNAFNGSRLGSTPPEAEVALKMTLKLTVCTTVN